jgi:hypothetical protein
MIGNLLETARQDAKKIVTAGGFTVTAVLSTPDNSTQISVSGLGTGTWMVFDSTPQGKPINSTSNSFNISVDQLIAANYPYLKNGRINIQHHKIIVGDAAGMGGEFEITEQHPNATLGMIVCILGRK